MYKYFMAIWNVLLTFGILYVLHHLVHFVLIWYIFPGFGIMYQEKSGNPGLNLYLGFSATSRSTPSNK
jgi:hypothetical protein